MGLVVDALGGQLGLLRRPGADPVRDPFESCIALVGRRGHPCANVSDVLTRGNQRVAVLERSGEPDTGLLSLAFCDADLLAYARRQLGKTSDVVLYLPDRSNAVGGD